MQAHKVYVFLKEEDTDYDIKPWRPAMTPEVATPVRGSASQSRSRLSRRRRPPLPDPRILTYLDRDSGSELEGGRDEDDNDDIEHDTDEIDGDGTIFDDVERLRAAARIIQDYNEALNIDEMVEIAGDVDAACAGAAVVVPGSAEVHNEFNWSEDFNSFNGRPEEYQRNPGPTYASQNGLDLFLLIWEDILPQIVTESNNYAWHTIMALSEHGRIKKNLDAWYDIDIDELCRYFTVLMYMAIDPRSSIREYWSTGVLGMPDFRALMSRNRFQMITRFLHFVSNENIPHKASSYQKKVWKIQPVLQYLNQKFEELYTPEQQLSLDESLLLWKGRLAWIQCIRSKAARFGIKCFDLCEASTGYLLRCIIYAGKDSSMHEGPIHGFTAPTTKIVLKLMDGFLEKGHVLYMDNWYNRLPMTRFLKSKKTDVVGTLLRNRRHVPDCIKNLRENDMRTGQRVACHAGDVAITTWKDVKLVTMISTCHTDQMDPGIGVGVEREKPICVSDYNKYMGGVDLKDKKLSMYLLERKRGLKWYMKVFRRLLNTSILNAFVMYTKNPMFRVLTHREFRFQLAEDLCARFRKERVGRPLAVAPVPAQGNADCRLDPGLQHFPDFTAIASGVRRSKRRCARCSARSIRSQVTTVCSACQVGLCIGQCWLEYHTLLNLN